MPLGGNITSIDIFVDDIPVPRKDTYIATSEDMVNATALSEDRPLSFKPYQSARFLVIKEGGLDEARNHAITVISKMQGFEQVVIPFRFSDRVSRRRGSIVFEGTRHDHLPRGEDATNFGNYRAPLVLSGRKAYVVCSSNGSLSANWTWMGVTYDNGGLYVPPVRVFGRTIVELSMNDGVRRRLPNFVVASKHENGVLETQHELAGLSIRRRLVVPSDTRGFIMSLDMRLAGPAAAATASSKGGSKRKQAVKKRKIRIHFLIDGNITSYGLAAVSHASLANLNREHRCLQISSVQQDGIDLKYFGTIGVAPKSLKPSRVITDSFDNDLEISYDFDLAEGEHFEMALVGTGSFTSREDCLDEFLDLRDNFRKLAQTTEDSFRRHSSATLSMATSQNRGTLSRLIMAYEKTKTCLQYLKTRYDGLGEGICAGLPRFPNYWARDTGWTLRGYLAIGDYGFARAAIRNFLRHQAAATSRTAIRGELPMIISGKAFLHSTTFGSADSTFLFPPAILQYALATGDLEFIKSRWQSVRDLVEWGFLKDIDGDGLVENDFTGVAEKMAIRDSTWMDHIDRRKSANDIQALFLGSLDAGARLANLVGDDASEEKWKIACGKLRDKIDSMYWNPESQYYYDTIRKDGSRDPSIRPNALVLLMTDAVRDSAKAEAVLSRIEQVDMTTGWGVRTLSSADPGYRPTLYHDGAVWPLVTGWAAISEIKYGRKEQALAYLISMAERILSENGMFAETYRGDRPEPFNSCILQAWSAGMYAWAFSEMMLGMTVDLVHGRIQIEPQISDHLGTESSAPLKVEYPLATVDGPSFLEATIDPSNRKISASFRGRQRPVILSDSYTLNQLNR
ncbi:MAG TPA: amylo-alpha-1,6-glucosidase [Nitrososphaera sp.]|nr:amylo-alpha-1,6-glucosidase [Nitrososphaera sp.]